MIQIDSTLGPDILLSKLGFIYITLTKIFLQR